MRVGGMLSEAFTPMFLLLLIAAAHTNALPFQYLPDIPGYIPVYIRHGDQPLEEINLALAEAFHESTNKIKKIPVQPVPLKAANEDLTDKNDVSLETEKENLAEKNLSMQASSKKLVYALPQINDTLQNKSKSLEKESVIMKLMKSPTSDKIDSKRIIKEIKEKEAKNQNQVLKIRNQILHS